MSHAVFVRTCTQRFKGFGVLRVVGPDTVGGLVVTDVPNRMAIALLDDFVFVHPVLKWLHHPPVKNVMLLQPASSSHDFLHAAMSATLLDDWLRYFSPLPPSHCTFEPTFTHILCAAVELVRVCNRRW